MKNISSIFGGLLLTGTLFANVACGMSPLLNHASPNRAAESARISNDADGDCAVYFAIQNLCAQLSWVQEPTRDLEGSMHLVFNREPNAASVGVKLWMPEMGHGSQKVVVKHTQRNEVDVDGEFDATEVFFVMPGKWEVIVQLKDASGTVIDSAKTSYVAQ
jgi:hypothetical protein